jgi:hypothetical protein
MNRKLFGLCLLTLALALGLGACGGAAQPTAAPTAQVIVATLPPPATVLVPVTVQVPVTVIVPQTVVVTATPAPTQPTEAAPTETLPAATSAPAATAAATPAAATTPADTQTAGAPLLAALPAVNTTPIAINGPDPMAGASGRLFEEYFAPPDFWGIGSDASSTVSIANGYLTIVNHKLRSLAWTLNGVKGKDFYAQAYVAPTLCGFGDNYGLGFRAKDNLNLELFGISCDGRYRLLEYSAGTATPIVDWTDSRYIRKYETTNVVGVRAAGDQVSLYVNDYYLGTVTAGANLEGRFGLYVGNIKTPDLTVNFTAVTAQRINP